MAKNYNGVIVICTTSGVYFGQNGWMIPMTNEIITQLMYMNTSRVGSMCEIPIRVQEGGVVMITASNRRGMILRALQIIYIQTHWRGYLVRKRVGQENMRHVMWWLKQLK
jgi:hypothetical protein